MSNKILSKPPGFEDIFPHDILKWDFINRTARNILVKYNYKEIVTPVLEYTEVFARGLGDETDVVSKEMFTFEDRGGRSLTLRPEGTASVVRAYVGNGDYNRLSTCKFFYFGPMFRSEKPQRGRLRQFNQFGAEVFGSDNPFYDYEIISMMDDFTNKIGIDDYTLLINSIGCPACRVAYIEKLKAYYSARLKELCNNCRRRYEKNPLRILDCKAKECASFKDNAPVISSFLCNDCRAHHDTLKEYLNVNKINYLENPHLVRGLDYYTKTTFEFVSKSLGGQNAFAAGGRYDNLVETFYGRPTPAIGFAAGIERIFLLIEEKKLALNILDIFIVYSGEEAFKKAIELSNMLRHHGLSVDIYPDSRGFKSQFKKADRENARFSLIIGEDELSANSCTIKDMKTGKQERVESEKIVGFFSASEF